MSLVSRFRAGLKAEIGVFFPMIVLRVLENVAQPNFQQKMIVLRFLEKLCIDSQILVDIFINYDCDVESSNIFERYFSSLLLTSCIGPFIQSNIMLRLKLDFYFVSPGMLLYVCLKFTNHDLDFQVTNHMWVHVVTSAPSVVPSGFRINGGCSIVICN